MSTNSSKSLVRSGSDLLLPVLGALLAVGVLIVHVKDQGGITAFADPDWLGWGYRLTEVGGLLTALALLGALALPAGRARLLSWTAAVLVGVGPFVGYLLSRTVGVPGDAEDKGNWADPVGTASLVIEAVLITVAVLALVRVRREARSASPARSASLVPESRSYQRAPTV